MAARPLTILQMIPELEGGGVERGTIELSSELVRQGHRSIVMSAGGRLVTALSEHGAEHVQWGIRNKSPWALRYVWPLRAFLQRERVDIVHARSRVPAWIAYLAWRGMSAQQRPRFVTTAHGLYSVNLYSEVMTRGERVIAISETVQNYLTNNYTRLNPDVIALIPRGVDPQEFPRNYQPSQQWLEQWYQAYPDLVGRPVISLIGRLTRLKGHRDLIRIVAQLKERSPELRALIVGGADPRRQQYADSLRDEVVRQGLQREILFTGHRSDVRDIYAVSSLVISLTSDPPEAFGRTTVEALTMGVPVVGYDHGGTGEILRKVFPAGLVAAGDVSAAAEKIHSLLQAPLEIPLNHEYTQAKMLKETISIYEELAA